MIFNLTPFWSGVVWAAVLLNGGLFVYNIWHWAGDRRRDSVAAEVLK